MYKSLSRRILKASVAAVSALAIIAHTALAFASEGYFTLDRVNIRSQASTESEVLTLVEAGKTVIVTAHNVDGWSQVTFNGISGYMKSEFIGVQGQSQAQTYQTLDNVNLRTQPTTNSEALTLVRKGTAVSVTEVESLPLGTLTMPDSETIVGLADVHVTGRSRTFIGSPMRPVTELALSPAFMYMMLSAL